MSGTSVIKPSRILLALDGSEHSKKAADMAIDCAAKWNSELYLIHVQEKMEIPEEMEQYTKIEHLAPEEYFEMVCARFIGEAGTKAKAAGVKKVENICVTGDPANEIIKAAEEYGVDIIVMGSRGLGRFPRIVMGSVSTKVANYSHCTVIAVK